MALEKLQYPILQIDGANYLSWSQNTEIVLNMKGLGDIIISDRYGDLQTKSSTLYIIRHHLHEDLQLEYLTEFNPRALWDKLKDRFEHLRLISLPQAHTDWINLRVLDHSTIAKYNGALFRITAQLAACGHPVDDAEQIEKTLSTFPASSMQLAQMYRQRNFRQYSELIAAMLLAEKNDNLLLLNNKKRPPGTLPIPETQFNERNSSSFRGRHPNYSNRGRPPKYQRYHPAQASGNSYRSSPHNRKNNAPSRQRQNSWTSTNTRPPPRQSSFRSNSTCFRCGGKGHIKPNCHAQSHLVKLYQTSIKNKGKQANTNYMEIEEDISTYVQDAPPTESHLLDATTFLSLPTDPDLCILDSGTTHSILKNKQYFTQILPSNRPITTITGQTHLESGHGPARISLPNGTRINIPSAIYAPTATRNLLSFQDIHLNNLLIRSTLDHNTTSLQLYEHTSTGPSIKETFTMSPPGLFATKITALHNTYSAQSPTALWHYRLGHPGLSMFLRIIKDNIGIPPTVKPSTLTTTCIPCSQGKLVTRPAISKTIFHIPAFLEELNADVCGPIDPASGPFRFFLGLICSSSKWSQVSLISSRNLVFARILTCIIQLRAQFPNNPIKRLRVDNAGEFTSPAFEDFCTILGIILQYSVAYVHFQNGPAEALMKRIQMISRPMLMHTKLPLSAWGHSVLHAAALLKFRPSSFNTLTPHHLAYGLPADISHLRVFGCLVLVPILGPKRNKMGPQRHKGIYVGYDSPSIVRYLEPTTGDLYKARYQDCHFREDIFPQLTNAPPRQPHMQLKWHNPHFLLTDPRTPTAETEVKRILHLSDIFAKLPDSFNDASNITRSHIEAANAPARIPITNDKAVDTLPKAKRGRPPGAKDKQPRQKRQADPTTTPEVNTLSHDNDEISIHYMHNGITWPRATTQPDEYFSYTISKEIIEDLPDPTSVQEAQNRPDWPQWNTAINSELDSLISRQVFGHIHPVPEDTHLTGYRITLVRKRNALGEVVRYKARLVAKGYTQIYGKDYDLTHSPVMDAITYRYMISFALQHNLIMHLMDVVTAYLYGILDTEIHMQAPPELIRRVIFHIQGEKSTTLDPNLQKGLQRIVPTTELRTTLINLGNALPVQPGQDSVLSEPDDHISDHQVTVTKKTNAKAQKQLLRQLSVQVLRSIYGLKQSGRIWYKRFAAEMLKLGFNNAEIAPCLFIKVEDKEFIIIAIYVDDINIFGTTEITARTIQILKNTFEMKDIGRTSYCLGLQIEHLPDGILLHQATYTKKILKQFNMHQSYPVTTPMELRSLDPNKDMYKKRTAQEPILGPEKPYLLVIGALMYLANQTRPDISFSTNLLARHSAQPTIRHWNGIKRVMRYLKGTIDTGLYYPKTSTHILTGFADAGYLSDPEDAKSQTGYVFLQGTTAISWKSVKQTLTTTSSNHAEIIALYETSRECIWLRQVINHINSSTGQPPITTPTTIYEDNRPCVEQITKGFIKGDKIKHIAPKFFHTHEQNDDQISVQWIPSQENRADLFTKPLPRILHEAHSIGIGLRKLSELQKTPT